MPTPDRMAELTALNWPDGRPKIAPEDRAIAVASWASVHKVRAGQYEIKEL